MLKRLFILAVFLTVAVCAQAQDFFGGDTTKTSARTTYACWDSTSAGCAALWGASTTIHSSSCSGSPRTCTISFNGTPTFGVNQFAPKTVSTTLSVAAVPGDTTFTPAATTNIGAGMNITITNGAKVFVNRVKSIGGGTFITWLATPQSFAIGSTVTGTYQWYSFIPDFSDSFGTYSTRTIPNKKGCFAYPIQSNTATQVVVTVPVVARIDGTASNYPDVASGTNFTDGGHYSVLENWAVEDFGTQRMLRDPLGHGMYLFSVSGVTTGGNGAGEYFTGTQLHSGSTVPTWKYGGNDAFLYFQTSRLRNWGLNHLGLLNPALAKMGATQVGYSANAGVCDGTTAITTAFTLSTDPPLWIMKETSRPNSSGSNTYWQSTGGGSGTTNVVMLDQPVVDLPQTFFESYSGNPDIWDLRFESGLQTLFNFYNHQGLSYQQYGTAGLDANAAWVLRLAYGESDSWQDRGNAKTHRNHGFLALATSPFVAAQVKAEGSPTWPYRARLDDQLNHTKMALRDMLACLYSPTCSVPGIPAPIAKGTIAYWFNWDFPYPAGTTRLQQTNLPVNPTLANGGQFDLTVAGFVTALANLNAAWGSSYTSWGQAAAGANILGSGAKTGCAAVATFNSTTIVADGGATCTFAALDGGSIVEITGGTGSGQINRITSLAGQVATLEGTWHTTPDATTVFRVSPHFNAPTSCTASQAHLIDNNNPFGSVEAGEIAWLIDGAKTTNGAPTLRSVSTVNNNHDLTLDGNCPSSATDLRYAIVDFRLGNKGTPLGTGFMDENGANTWLKSGGALLLYPLDSYYSLNFSGNLAYPIVRDLNYFIQLDSARHFQIFLRQAQAYLPNLITTEPEAFGGDQTDLIKGSAGQLDIWIANIASGQGSAGTGTCQAVGDFTPAGCLLSGWYTAENDSPIANQVDPSLTAYSLTGRTWGTQTDRAAAWTNSVHYGMSAKSAGGINYVIGRNIWRLMGDCTEGGGGRDYGLVTAGCGPDAGRYAADNAYDGVEDTATSGSFTIAAGCSGTCNNTFTTPTTKDAEATSYGNFTGPLKTTTDGIYTFMASPLTVSVKIYATGASIDYGLASSDAVPNRVASTCAWTTNAALTANAVTLTGLYPGTYCYRIKDGGGNVISGQLEFKVGWDVQF